MKFSSEAHWQIALQLRQRYGQGRFHVWRKADIIFVRPLKAGESELADMAAFYLRSMGWRVFESDGPEPLIVVTGRA